MHFKYMPDFNWFVFESSLSDKSKELLRSQRWMVSENYRLVNDDYVKGDTTVMPPSAMPYELQKATLMTILDNTD